MHRREEKVDFRAWVQCPQDKVADALARWLAIPEDNRPVEKTILGMMRKSSVFVETQFLSLAQALEGFGRIRFQPGNGRSASFGQLLQKTYDLISPDLAEGLVGERLKFSNTVVQTRNFFTHLGIPRKSAVVDDPKQLFLLNQRLQAFLRCVMLTDLEVPEAFLKEPILYQATKWR